ncbi:hypothetical protein [Herbiconiux solani]|uniref:hypothetical protein n=1 Tax=Herbiconiux solani TaxID=661329 RepID=UPI0008267281|nr:hypothetical protein [Herbiconiux solani]
MQPLFVESAGRRRRAALVVRALPERIGTFFEPYLDSGATAVAALQAHPEARFTFAGDDAEVIAAWNAVRDDVAAVISELRRFVEEHDAAAFGRELARGEDELAALPPETRSARLLYLRGAAGPAPASRSFSAIRPRDTVAVDEGNLRALAALLADRDAEFVRRTPFELLPAVQEDDVVLVDPPFDCTPGTEREVRSLVNALTARGALVLGDVRTGSGADAPYSGWPGMTAVPLPGGDEDERAWANGGLVRALRREVG